MRSAAKALSRLTAIVIALTLIVPVLTSSTAAQDGGKVLRVHHVRTLTWLTRRRARSQTKLTSWLWSTKV